jgi:hypothetical protein
LLTRSEALQKHTHAAHEMLASMEEINRKSKNVAYMIHPAEPNCKPVLVLRENALREG